jgi:hypothetical protein
MLQEAFGDNAMSQSKTLWYKRFTGGQTFVDDGVLDDLRQAQHRKTAKVCETILADCRRTIHGVCEIVGLLYGTFSMHCGGQFEHEMHLCEVCTKTAEQRPEDPSRFCLQGTQTTSQRCPRD